MSEVSLAIQIGHFHPLLVHLPIGIILLAFALEMYNRFRPKTAGDEMILFSLGFAGVTALISLGTGWLLGEEGGFDEDLLFLHRWMAVAFTATTILLFFLKRSKSASVNKLYLPVFVVVLILVSITGHYGGNMTHGEDYLFRDTSSNNIVITDIAEANAHTDIIQPILNSKCVSCHNQGKVKGGLLMTTAADLLKGGDSGSVFDSIDGKPLLIHRMHLPMEDEEHMPPKGKVQLTPDEIALMEWWVNNDHCLDCKVKSLKTSERLEIVLASLEEDDSPHAIIAKELEQVPTHWLEEMNASGITVYPLSEDNPLLIANLFGAQKQLKQKLIALDKFAENIVELNLANSRFNDTIADLIAPFKHLTKLQLQNTGITDRSIPIFENFEFLESLNLYGTNIGNLIFETAQNIPGLKALYLFETQVTEVEKEKFQEKFPNINVQHIPKDAFKAASLSAPVIVAETAFFKDTLEIALENTFEDSKIYYTLDGTLPDSTSTLYTAPFQITDSRLLQAVVLKEGWQPSKISTQKFKTTSVDYIDVALNKLPNEKYKAQEGKTLIDLKRGSTNFVDGAWLGYEGSHFSTTLTLKENKEISSVSVGALSAPASWIFYPVGLTVYTSENGKRFKRIKSIKLPKEEPSNDVTTTFFDMEIPPTKAKYVKVEIKSPLKNPSWHTNPGGNSWIFIDEIILN
ncbi:FN3 associated domain-containing protein [Maribacter sp. 2210JD10-5]|uniref:FN3 associated domain-containing protein n=1 Tax=Maribacter sp. 2210JD10-5 TaxID=3386272 RepID=UPI0039BC55D9